MKYPVSDKEWNAKWVKIRTAINNIGRNVKSKEKAEAKKNQNVTQETLVGQSEDADTEAIKQNDVLNGQDNNQNEEN